MTHHRDIVLGHTRLSWGRDDSGSPRRQEGAIQAWARQNGYNHNVEIFADVEGRHSGRKEQGRPEWKRLRSRLSDPHVAVVIVESVDRLFRNLKLLLDFVDGCTEKGIRFVSLAERLDFQPSDNPMEAAMRRMSLQQFGALAEMWANITSAKMQMHVEAMRDDGKHWGICPFGTIRANNGKLTACPETYPALAELYQLYGESVGGWNVVADKLNEQGYLSRDRAGNPRPFTAGDVRLHIDQHLTYAGHLVKGRSQSATGPQILLQDAWDPILPLPLIQDALAVRETRTVIRATPERLFIYPLTPLLHCSSCGKQLYGQRERQCKGGERRYRHQHKGKCKSYKGQINADVAEAVTIQLIADLLPPPSTWDVLTAVMKEEADDSHANRERRAQLQELRTRKERLTSHYIRQIEEGEVVGLKEMAAKIASYETQISQLEAQASPSQGVEEFRNLLHRLGDIKKLLEGASPQIRQELIGMLFEQLDFNLSTRTIAKYKAREWLAVYINSAIKCAWRDSNPHEFYFTSPSS
jgi:DNA invertase Pin-like site-specific DNA recombinase